MHEEEDWEENGQGKKALMIPISPEKIKLHQWGLMNPSRNSQRPCVKKRMSVKTSLQLATSPPWQTRKKALMIPISPERIKLHQLDLMNPSRNSLMMLNPSRKSLLRPCMKKRMPVKTSLRPAASPPWQKRKKALMIPIFPEWIKLHQWDLMNPSRNSQMPCMKKRIPVKTRV